MYIDKTKLLLRVRKTIFVIFGSHLSDAEYMIGIHKENANSPESFQQKKVCFPDIPSFQFPNAGTCSRGKTVTHWPCLSLSNQCSCLETASEK